MPARTQEKSARALRFLLALRHPAVCSAMVGCGMRDADAQHGWSLLQAMGAIRLDKTPPPAPKSAGIRDVHDWQTRWFPIVEATLRARFPGLAVAFFNNLSPRSGPEVMVSAQLLVDRIDRLADAAGTFGPDGPCARVVMAERGFTAAVLDRGKALLAGVHRPEMGPSPEPDDEAIACDEAALWRWYGEWSAIARASVKEHALLRRMGFRMVGGAGDEPDDAGAGAAGSTAIAGRSRI
jgi:hypothetical protein